MTDGELGKNLPGRDLGVGQEEQDGLTAEMIKCDFLIEITFIYHFLTLSKNTIANLLLGPEAHYCASGFVGRYKVNYLTSIID